MKKNVLKISCILLLTLLMPPKSIGQNIINGNWTVYCIMEQTDKVTITFCDFCPMNMSEDKTKISIEKFDMIFNQSTLDIIIEGVSTNTPYIYDNDTKTIEFTFKEKKHKFKLLMVMGNSIETIVLRDNDGSLILLEKKE